MTAPANILRPAAHARVLAPFALAALFTAQLAYAGPAENPFLPPASTAAAAAAPTENLEFAGINVMSEKTFVVVHDKQAKKSRWIAVGESQAGLTVLAYDPRREQIVIKFGDAQKTLSLRKGAGSSGVGAPAPVAVLPSAAGFAVAPPPISFEKPQPPPPTAALGPIATLEPSPVPVAPPAPSPVTEQKPHTSQRQEEEARMLVSDLLEIGMAQRRAYEDAQKKASEQPAPTQPPSGP
jgi:hypothetical protein